MGRSRPIRHRASGKALFHGDRVELREEVTCIWSTTSYSEMYVGEPQEIARTMTVLEHGFTLRGDKLEPDATSETPPPRPGKKKP